MGVLSEYVVDTVSVKLPHDKVLAVRGLCLVDLSEMIQDNAILTGKLMEGDINVTDLLTMAPDFAAQIIARAADEKEYWSKVLKMPATIQLEALLGIWDLSVVGEDTVKKLVDRFKTLASDLKLQASPASV